MKPFVYIVESPNPQDLMENRCEGHTLGSFLALAGIEYRYTLTVNKAVFVDAIQQKLRAEAFRLNMLPILHISAHGNEYGIELTDGSFIFWTELGQLLKPAHDISNTGLIVCLSACSGAFGTQMAMQDFDSKVFGALVSHSGKAIWSDAAVGYVAFYNRLSKGHSFQACVDAMCSATGDNRFMLWFGRDVQSEWVAHEERFKKQTNITPPADGFGGGLLGPQPPSR